ncbi:radical SAM protein [Embleya sp. NPDC001921]
MYELIASQFLDGFLVLRPGDDRGVVVSEPKFQELESAAACGGNAPEWLEAVASQAWGVDVAGAMCPSVMVRERSPYGYGRASYELNLGCNYDCPMCYLALKKFDALDWPDRVRLLEIMRDAGVLWIQLTGGEAMIDPGFLDVYELAYRFGMMISVSTNGSRLWRTEILSALTAMRPYRITVSVYGATAASYEATTQRKGSYKTFLKGVSAAHEAGLPLRMNIIVTATNDHEVPAMEALADSFEAPRHTYTNMAPTIYGGGESLLQQSPGYRTQRKRFGGCNAGHTFFHADPHGIASICKVGRDPAVDLMKEGVQGLRRLGPIADSLMLRTGGCSGCRLSDTCFTCRPLAKQYQEAKAPLESYCRHGRG